VDVRLITSESQLQKCVSLLTQDPLWSEYGRDVLEEHIHNPSMTVTGLFTDGDIVGFAAVLQPGMVFEPMLTYLCVKQDMQRHRVGSVIMDHIESAHPRLYLTVTENNSAREFYEKRGWVQVGRLPDHEESGVAELIMRKTATQPYRPSLKRDEYVPDKTCEVQ
jgi:ribosomal protein S18 acetylase RimI-like enzyme